MIALYPGAYKPPHRGHFNVVKSLLDGSYNGAVYNKDNYKETGAELLKGKRENKPKINKVIIFVGGGERNGITKEESMSIWNIYAKYLGNVEIVDGQKNPMFAAKDHAQANPKEEFVAVTGIRGEKDFVDLKRVTTFKNAPNVQGLALTAAPGSGVRATDFRNSILSGNLDKITDFFPEELSREEILNILTDLKDKIVAEILASNIEGFVEGYFKETESIEEVIQEQQSDPQLKDYITSLTEYMLELGMNITPLPEVKLRKDEANASNFFGRTAYYDPNAREVVLYITGRHDKDIVRSYAHEMIHHMQNLQGTLHDIQTQDTNEDDKLLELEKEAYTLGNITFRNWEDSIKNADTVNEIGDLSQEPYKWTAFDKGKDSSHKCWHDNTPHHTPINEGRYDKITNVISKVAFILFKRLHDKGEKKGKFNLRVGNPEHDEVDIPSKQFEFDLQGYFTLTDDTYSVDGGANAGYDNEGDEIQPLMNLNFSIPKEIDWQEVSMDIKDVVRHELEHLTQDGENLKPGKFIEDDEIIRGLIDMKIMDKDEYYKLPKEVDAMIQGMYFKAKKSKIPFKNVVEDYFNKAGVKLENRKKIRILWNKRLPKLGIKQRL